MAVCSKRWMLLQHYAATSIRPSVCARCLLGGSLRISQDSANRQRNRRPFTASQAVRDSASTEDKRSPAITSLRTSTAKAIKLAPPAKPRRLAKATFNAEDTPQSFLTRTITEPTIIYTAPKQRPYLVAAGALGTFFCGYASYIALPDAMRIILGMHSANHLNTVYMAPIMVVAGIALNAIGFYCYAGGHKLIKQIVFIPSKSAKDDAMAEVTVTKLLPFWPQTYTIPASEIRLGRQVAMNPFEEPKPSRFPDRDEVPFFSWPLLALAKGVGTFYEETKNSFQRLPMVTMWLPGHGKFKLDVRGRAWQGASGLDRIFPVDINKSAFWDR